MESEVVASLGRISKKYKIFDNRLGRLFEALDPLGRSRHTDFWALKDVSFQIHRGECIGILGRNGSGKSTLLQIIAGVLRATGGELAVHGQVAALLELGSGFDPNLTGRENVHFLGRLHGLSSAEIRKRVEVIETFADIGEFFDRQVRIYSSGMHARLAFSTAIHVDPDLLIIDETLAVGDAKFQEKCFRRLSEIRAAGTAILLVSHDVNTMIQICDRCLLLNGGVLEFIGPPKDAVNLYHNILFGSPLQPAIPVQAVGGHLEAGEPEEPNGYGTETQPLGATVTEILDWLRKDTTLVDRCSTRRSFSPQFVKLGDGRATILDYIIVAGQEVDAFLIGRNVRIELFIRVHYHVDIQRPVIGCALLGRGGVWIYSTNTRLQGMSLPPAVANQIVIYKFEFENFLRGGDYFLNLGVSTLSEQGEDVFVDTRRGIAHLVIETAPGAIGLVDLRGHFSHVGSVMVPQTGHDERKG